MLNFLCTHFKLYKQVGAQYIFGNKWLISWPNLITLQAVSDNLHDTKSGAFRSSFGASPSLEIEGGREYHLGWLLRGLHSKSNCFETSNQRVNLGPHKDSMNTFT